ncbi:hypothetical protein [Terrimonas pollutisoli]|uniref:hypothetical protein n=1 Tax=Terrimonas pollutisoli TaxID=3034147 RepID=UPI0023EACAFC|nr:hypothetical protein [Terrimonas sp. H1YJ31]
MRILFFLTLLPLKLLSQDFSGVWTGHIYSKESQLPYELVISGEKNNLGGYSLTIFIIGDVQNTGIKSIKIKDKRGSIAIEDDKVLYNDYQTASKKVTLYAELSFEDGSANVLRGSFFTRSLDRSSYKGTIRLERNDDHAQTKLITHLVKLNLVNDLSFLKPKTTAPVNRDIAVATEKLKQPAVNNQPARADAPIRATVRGDTSIAAATEKLKQPAINNQPAQADPPILTPVIKEKDPAIAASLPEQKKVNLSVRNSAASMIEVKKTNAVKPVKAAAADLAMRKTEIIRDINFKSDSLILNLYDNGEVDGDTVSVLVNGKLVIARKGLTANAVKTTVYASEGFGDSLQVVMYAENLGRIPPNTGLLVVEDGEDKYQIRFEGDFQKNAAIVFRRKR